MSQLANSQSAWDWKTPSTIGIRQPKVKPMTAAERTASVLRVNPVSSIGCSTVGQHHTTKRISQAAI